jgi:hypothetical protein
MIGINSHRCIKLESSSTSSFHDSSFDSGVVPDNIAPCFATQEEKNRLISDRAVLKKRGWWKTLLKDATKLISAKTDSRFQGWSPETV